MGTFVKKIMDWVLESEEKAAKECHVSPEEAREQIRKLLVKKKELEDRCKEQSKELEHLLDRLHWIKAETLRCERKLYQKE